MTIYKKNLKQTIKKALSYWKIPVRKPLSQWADENFYLSAESSAEQGGWKCLPYQVEILDAMGDDNIPRVTMKKSARTGYTKMLLIVIAMNIKVLQRSIMVVQPTDGDARDFSKDEVSPMIRDVKCLKGLVDTSRLSSTHLKKSFVGGVLDIVGAHSARGLRRLTKDVGLFDEIAAYGITEEGCPIKLGEMRLFASPFPKYIYGSTPVRPHDNIDIKYEQSDKRRFHVPCPHCGELQYLQWKEDKMDYGLTYEEDNPSNAYYICKHCACRIDEKDKWEMLDNGKWIAEKPFAGHAGFHIWAAYSPYPNAAWHELAKEHYEAIGNPELMKKFYNTVLGEVFEDEEQEKIGWEALYARREHYQFDVPQEVKVLTVGIDTQDDRFEYEVIGWGAHEESWGIKYGVIHGDLRRPDVWNILADHLRATFRKPDGTMMNISFGCMDSQGHFTDEVHKFSKQIGRKFIIPIFGAKNPDKPVAKFPRSPNEKGTYRMEVGVSAAKDIWYSRYRLQKMGPCYCHYPAAEESGYDETYFKGATAEFKKKKKVNDKQVLAWHCPDGVRNEPTDCRNYALAAIRVLQQSFGVVLEDPEAPQQRKSVRKTRKLS